MKSGLDIETGYWSKGRWICELVPESVDDMGRDYVEALDVYRTLEGATVDYLFEMGIWLKGRWICKRGTMVVLNMPVGDQTCRSAAYVTKMGISVNGYHILRHSHGAERST